ncbi:MULTISPECIES: glycosyltransferase [unclassified Marinobacterium]|uniref:glycosyltransferase n=1 Tax=unclassified Marinobacterium TaxID=2644139 RepID=UPI00156A562B|nr:MULTISPECIES: glycosyltransferase [unclassified Marinobacterium]NRP09213.1 N-acetylgalactosamine-N,N'-diacetylbacillosaminyl-diphospho-undecaprenol [Marinobacterium sp. xm-g-48]NRP82256.1 N-acetylgalactosamine-N,N'-diacetylbacillosaminyl-diphospho-undecaprenol [Marinobacterium sp. xm-d-509]
MKILAIMPWLRKGGAEKNTIKLINQLATQHDVELLVFSQEYSDLESFISPNIAVSSGLSWFSVFLKVLFSSRCDIVFCSDHKVAFFMVLIRKFLFFKGFKVGFRCINNISALLINRSLFFKFIFRDMISRADFVIAQCEGMKSDLVNSWGLLPSNIHVIYNSLDSKSFVSAPLKLKSNKKFLYVGRFSQQKRLESLVEAFLIANLHKSVLTLVGFREDMVEDRNTLARIYEVIDRIESNGRVFIEPWTNDSSVHYKSHSFFLLASSYEGFPNVLIEAISNGLVLVSSDCDFGPREIIDDYNGLLVTDFSVESFSYAIESAAEKKWNRDYIVSKAHRFDDLVQLPKINFVVEGLF